MSSGGNLRSPKLSARLYFRFDEKNKFSVKIYSKLFSSNNAPLKNSSLEAKKGLKDNPVLVLKEAVFFLV